MRYSYVNKSNGGIFIYMCVAVADIHEFSGGDRYRYRYSEFHNLYKVEYTDGYYRMFHKHEFDLYFVKEAF